VTDEQFEKIILDIQNEQKLGARRLKKVIKKYA